MSEKPTDEPPEISLKQKLHSETACIAWTELQRFFAQGSVMWLKDGYDLIDVAVSFAEDNAGALQKIIDAGDLAAPTNDQARNWYESDAQLWSVVVAPFVLVQERSTEKQE
ncbi:MAG: DUF2288 domain-containing protein [Pseudomonadota bacterium]